MRFALPSTCPSWARSPRKRTARTARTATVTVTATTARTVTATVTASTESRDRPPSGTGPEHSQALSRNRARAEIMSRVFQALERVESELRPRASGVLPAPDVRDRHGADL